MMPVGTGWALRGMEKTFSIPDLITRQIFPPARPMCRQQLVNRSREKGLKAVQWFTSRSGTEWLTGQQPPPCIHAPDRSPTRSCGRFAGLDLHAVESTCFVHFVERHRVRSLFGGPASQGAPLAPKPLEGEGVLRHFPDVTSMPPYGPSPISMPTPYRLGRLTAPLPASLSEPRSS